MQDFLWHQNRLKTYLQNQSASNLDAARAADALAQEAMRFWETADGWLLVPPDLRPAGFARETDWPSYCMSKLDRAVAARDMRQIRHWAGELAQAAFSLADLHRWLGFLVEDQLTALEFQQQCRTLFAGAEALHQPYDPQSTISQFPAGVIGLNGVNNYYEVERQAEQLFSMPSDRFDEITHLTPESLWVMPEVRECFLKMQAQLGPENRKAWQLAARTPYHHSYLIDMLFRSRRAGTDDQMCAVLKKFDAQNPNASISKLLDVLMYRGHSFAGLEWADRFQPKLLDAAGEISPPASDADAFAQACRWTNDFSRAPASYGLTLTLRDALEQKRLDCVRATDMIGAIFRNSGRSGFGHVRWCSESAGHSIAACVDTDDEFKPILVDGLNPPPKQPEVWRTETGTQSDSRTVR